MNRASENCQFCSVVSKANGEDPIGTAGHHEHWLIMEIPLPWTKALFFDNPKIQPLMKRLQSLIVDRQIKLRPIAIALDRDYSQPGYTRILYYRKPAEFFAQYEQQEYLVPETAAIQLAIALLNQIIQEPNELDQFRTYQQLSQTRDILVCTHGNVDAACAKFGYPIYKQLRDRYAQELSGQLRVWRCSHFGGHQFAPTLIDLPIGQYWGHLESTVLDQLIYRQGDVRRLRSCYRGWAGLGKFEQMLDRELWMQEGWQWLTYPRKGQVIDQDQGRLQRLQPIFDAIPVRLRMWLDRHKNPPQWAKVQIQSLPPDHHNLIQYEATIEASNPVMSALQSQPSLQLKLVPQYHITQLK
jgi:hypothetical protein